MNTNAGIFLDRDGTIIEDKGDLSDPSQVVFIDQALDALALLQKHFRLFIVTNQPAVANGRLTLDDVHTVNRRITEKLKAENIRIADVFVCPHDRKDNCLCIKPKPFFPRKAASDHNIDLTRSFSIGDHPCDVQLAQNLGGKGLYVLTGHGQKHQKDLPPDTIVFPDIKSAADWILKQIT